MRGAQRTAHKAHEQHYYNSSSMIMSMSSKIISRSMSMTMSVGMIPKQLQLHHQQQHAAVA
jgi:hypothetical protein